MALTAQRVRTSMTVVAVAARRRDVFFVVSLTGITYSMIYLFMLGQLGFQATLGFDLLTVAEPFSRMFEPGPGRFVFEPIAIVDVWLIRLLFSPINAVIGAGLGLLVGVNLGLSYLAIVQPKRCGLGASSGVMASVPAVLAGGACCAPVVLIVLGITAGGTLLAVISWLLPLGVLLLIVSLFYLAAQINPIALSMDTDAA